MYVHVSNVYLHAACRTCVKCACPSHYMYVYVCVCMCMYLYVLVCICMYHIAYMQYIHIHTYMIKFTATLQQHCDVAVRPRGVYMCMYLYV